MPNCRTWVQLEAPPAAWYFFLLALWPLDKPSYSSLLLPNAPTGMAVADNPIKAGHGPAALAGASEVSTLSLQAGGCRLKTGRADGSAP